MSSHSEDSTKISRDAFGWLLGAGAFAVVLSVSLAVVDYKLSHSTSEQKLANTLRELRTAQIESDSRVTDLRQLQEFAVQPRGSSVVESH